MNIFIEKYLSLIQKQFSDQPFAKSIPDWLLEGTYLMLQNDGSQTNKEKFLRFFKEKSGMSEEEIWGRFLTFYQGEFNQLRKITTPVPQAANFLQVAVKKGFKLVLATQPVFPTIALQQRLNWAGLAHLPFELITDISLMTACKPSATYYQHLLAILKTSADRCLMIGNEVETDMAARKYCINTFFINQSEERVNKPDLADYIGDFKKLAKLLAFY
jgi:FMN phosphatase YigB (HAD superfamily)